MTTYYAAYRLADGQLVRFAPFALDPAEGEGVATFDRDAPPDLATEAWNAATLAFEVVPPPAPAPRNLSPLEFYERFTGDEQAALELAALGLAPDGLTALDALTRARFLVLSRRLSTGHDVDVADELTVGAVVAVVGYFASTGLVAPEDVETRRAALLAPAGTYPRERAATGA